VLQSNPAPIFGSAAGTPGWSRPEVDGIGSEPLAKTGHSSQAETLGVSLNHKSNLFPSGIIGHPVIISWPLRGDGDKYTLGVETNNRHLYQHKLSLLLYLSWACVSNRVGLTILPSYILASMDVICLLIHSCIGERCRCISSCLWCNNYRAHCNSTFNHKSYSTIHRSTDQTRCSLQSLLPSNNTPFPSALRRRIRLQPLIYLLLQLQNNLRGFPLQLNESFSPTKLLQCSDQIESRR